MKKTVTALTLSAILLAGCSSSASPSAVNTPVPGTDSLKPDGTTTTEQELIHQVSGDMQLVGTWLDKEDSRIILSIIESEKNVYELAVSWPKSDSESEEWFMHGSYDPSSGMLSYSDGLHQINGEAVKDENHTGTGTFMKEGPDTLRWKDDPTGNERVFERNPEVSIPFMSFVDGPYRLNSVYESTVGDEINTDLQKAAEGQFGIGLKPVAVLATQVVNGTNYAVLAYAEFTLNKFTESYAMVTYNKAPSGEINPMSTSAIDINQIYTAEKPGLPSGMGSWTLAETRSVKTTEAADQAFHAAMEKGADFLETATPIVLLGTMEQDGTTTYRFLAKGTAPGSDESLYIIDVLKKTDETIVESAQAFDFLHYLQ